MAGMREGRPPRYIAVEGPIGVGKTSLARLLAAHLGGRAILETVEENPFLGRFYEDPEKYAFQTQLFFLLSRFRQQMELSQQDLFHPVTVTDFIFEKDRIFANVNLTQDELSLYEQVYSLLEHRVVKPDLVIYLQASTEVLLKRIKSRGWEFEKGIEAQYVDEIRRAYQRFFFYWKTTPLLVVDTSWIDFVNRKQDLAVLLKAIERGPKGVEYFIPRDLP
jgi:deoxyadenosine/deoxycytidine kinase